MYGLMVALKPTRVASVTRGHNEGLNFGNVVTYTKAGGASDFGSGGNSTGRKIVFWNCGGNHLKIITQNLARTRRKNIYGE